MYDIYVHFYFYVYEEFDDPTIISYYSSSIKLC